MSAHVRGPSAVVVNPCVRQGARLAAAKGVGMAARLRSERQGRRREKYGAHHTPDFDIDKRAIGLTVEISTGIDRRNVC